MSKAEWKIPDNHYSSARAEKEMNAFLLRKNIMVRRNVLKWDPLSILLEMKPEGKHLTPLMTDNRFYVPERTLSGRRWAIRGFARNYFTKEDIDELVSSCSNHVVDYHKFSWGDSSGNTYAFCAITFDCNSTLESVVKNISRE
jgi:hypothetical protein